jgi:predicted transcriptional regulator
MGGCRGQGPLAVDVVAALAAAEAPLSPAEVQAALGPGLAYDKVRTSLVRLWEKGVVARRLAGRDHVYWPLRAAAADAAGRMVAARLGRHRRPAGRGNAS